MNALDSILRRHQALDSFVQMAGFKPELVQLMNQKTGEYETFKFPKREAEPLGVCTECTELEDETFEVKFVLAPLTLDMQQEIETVSREEWQRIARQMRSRLIDAIEDEFEKILREQEPKLDGPVPDKKLTDIALMYAHEDTSARCSTCGSLLFAGTCISCMVRS